MPRYTQEQHAWLREHYPMMTNAELSLAFCERFGIDVTSDTMHSYGSNHRLHKQPGVRDRALRRYTDEQNEWLMEFIPGHSEREIIDAYRERFGVTLSARQVSNRKVALGVKSGTVGGRFEHGHEPPNKGKTWDEYGTPEGHERSRRTTYSAGHVPHNAYRELLDEREDKDGLWVYVRPRDRKFPANDWLAKGRFEWMRANGRDWPEGHNAVFADGDNRNLDPDNIVPVPKDLYVIVTGGAHGHALPYHDRETLELAVTHARIIRERRRLELANHTCKVCGATFTARYPRQRTCDGCMGARRTR